MTKITKRDYFNILMEVVDNSKREDADDLNAFLQAQIDLLDKKNEAAKARNEKKRKESDELSKLIIANLTDELQSINQLMEKIEWEDLTPSKISSRMKSFVNEGTVRKEYVKEGSRKVVGYAIAAEGGEEAE